jgi:RND family efflux transporter MFP subunit
LGITSPRWHSEVRAQTRGRLIRLDTTSEPGTLVKKGQILAQLETTELRSRLADAFSGVKDAELALEREQHEQTVALNMLSLKNASAYARHEPQIAAAQAALNKARADFASAGQDLKNATITAPFDAIILQRRVSPKQYVDIGQVLFEVAASDSLDVQVPVSEMDWPRLAAALPSPEIDVVDRQHAHWPAEVRYISPLADPVTRQRQLVLTVKHPYQGQPRLLDQQQVQVNITLVEQPHAVKIPSSALTRDGWIWTVDNRHRLKRESVTVLKEQDQIAWIVFAQDPEQERLVVVYPLISMLSGQQVAPEPIQSEMTPVREE